MYCKNYIISSFYCQENKAIEYGSHAEGYKTEAKLQAHAEGNSTKAYGNISHAEGYLTKAEGEMSHAEGYSTEAIGKVSHASGVGTIASAEAQTVVGKFNQKDADALFIVGNGNSDTQRQNIFAIKKNKLQGALLHGQQVATTIAGNYTTITELESAYSDVPIGTIYITIDD